MTVPKGVRLGIKQKLWLAAEQLRWSSLGQSEKARYYEIWTKDSEIGGLLARYMDRGQIRVYIKDTLLKDYGRVTLADPVRPMRALGIDVNASIAEKFIKPHGRRLEDGRILCWGRADAWKAILMALHERAFPKGRKPFGVVMMSASGRYHDLTEREVVEDAARKLGIEKLVWLE